MAEDGRRAGGAISQLERELAVRQGHMAAQAEEMAGLQDAQRSAHVQINQYIVDLQVLPTYTPNLMPMQAGFQRIKTTGLVSALMLAVFWTCTAGGYVAPFPFRQSATARLQCRDTIHHTTPSYIRTNPASYSCMQAFERQVEVLGRQLSRGAHDSEGQERERQQLLTELRSAEQVSLLPSLAQALTGCVNLYCSAALTVAAIFVISRALFAGELCSQAGVARIVRATVCSSLMPQQFY